MGKGKQVSQSTSSSDIHDTQHDQNPIEIDLDLVISRIDAFLSAIDQYSPGSKYIPPQFKLTDLAQPAVLLDYSKVFDGISSGAKKLYGQKKLISKLCGEAQNDVLAALKGVGNLHFAAAGLLIVAHVLERYQMISSNKEECLGLLKRMNDLAKGIRHLKNFVKQVMIDNHVLEKEMEDKMKEGVILIVQGAIMCFSQMRMKRIYKLLCAPKNREDLGKLGSEIEKMRNVLQFQMTLYTLELGAPNSEAPSSTPERLYPKHAVGIEKRVKQVINLLEMESDKSALAVVVLGFGGTGKTTVADAVFGKLELNQYKYSKVNLNEYLQYNPEITKLQEKILQDLARPANFRRDISDIRSGRQALGEIIQKECVLLYIDNALRKDDLRNLLPEKLDGPKKIRLLITARNRIVSDALVGCGIEFEVYPLEALSFESAKELMYMKIGREITSVKEKYHVDEIAKKGSGSPLLLELISGYLQRRGYDDEAYEGVLQWFQTGEPFSSNTQDAYNYDSIVFKDLAETAQDAFLDICSFFYGWGWEEVSSVVGKENMQTLLDGALVKKLVPSNRVHVHDVLIGIGLQKSKDLRFRPRTTEELEELNTALDDIKNADKIKGIWLMENKMRFDLSAGRLEQMHCSLRVLALGDWTVITDGICKNAFGNLLFFQAGDVPSLPFNARRLKKLTFLDNRSGQDMHCLNGPMIPSSLRTLKLTGRMHRRKVEIAPQAIEKLSKLQILELRGFVELIKLPDAIRVFTKLTVLDLKGCGVTQLPDSLGDLLALQTLNLMECKGLRQLPESIGNLRSLQTLNLDNCHNLIELPEKIVFLSSLSVLSLHSCWRMQKLPESLGLLSSLIYLKLRHCHNLQQLPGSFDKLVSLTTLDLLECMKLAELPWGLGNLPSLACLGFERCWALTRLPPTIGRLRLVWNSIRMKDCRKLTELPEEFCDLTFVEDLCLANCFCLERLPRRFMELTSLRRLELSHCESLSKLPDGFYKLRCLEELDLTGCSKLEDLCKDFECLPSLKRLEMSECKRLKGIWMESVVNIMSLRTVIIQGSGQLENQWAQMKSANQQWHCAVITGQDTKDQERLLKVASSLFFSDGCIVVDSRKNESSPSASRPGTTLTLIFGPRPFADTHYVNDWRLVSENLEELKRRSNDMQVIYIDRWNTVEESRTWDILNRLPEGSRGLPACSEISTMLITALENNFGSDYHAHMIFTGVDVDDELGHKCFSQWEDISNLLWEKFTLESERYLNIKHEVAAGNAGGGNIGLLTALLATEETDFLLRSNTEQVKVDELSGKQVVLFITRLRIVEALVSILKEAYFKIQERHTELEVVWVPVIDHYSDDTWGCYVTRASSMPWLTIPNPWLLESAVLKFLKEDWGEDSLVVVDGEGRVLNDENAMDMVVKWGVEAYPFTRDRNDQLKNEEFCQFDLISNVAFLFQDLEARVNVTAALTKRLICLCGGNFLEISDFMSNLSSSFGNMRDFFHMVCVGNSSVWKDELEGAIYDNRREGKMWPSLSTSDAYRFWNRISNLRGETARMECSEKLLQFKRLVVELQYLERFSSGVWMVMLDEKGDEVVTGRGEKLAEELRKGGDEETSLGRELSEGLRLWGVRGLTQVLKRRFDDGIVLPRHHPQHSFRQFYDQCFGETIICDLCHRTVTDESFYHCIECDDFGVCQRCSELEPELE